MCSVSRYLFAIIGIKKEPRHPAELLKQKIMKVLSNKESVLFYEDFACLVTYTIHVDTCAHALGRDGATA